MESGLCEEAIEIEGKSHDNLLLFSYLKPQKSRFWVDLFYKPDYFSSLYLHREG